MQASHVVGHVAFTRIQVCSYESGSTTDTSIQLEFCARVFLVPTSNGSSNQYAVALTICLVMRFSDTLAGSQRCTIY